MEFALNELGQPVIYIVNYVYVEHNVRQASFEVAVATLQEAKDVAGTRTCFEIIEQNMLTGEQCPVSLIKRQLEEKALLVSLYKGGEKRRIFEELEVRTPFQEQLTFPIAPELEKAKKKAAATLSV